MSITKHEYYEELNSLVEEIKEQLEERECVEISDIVHELIDQHEWVIYNANHDRIIYLSDNSDYYQDIYCSADIGEIVAEHGLDHMRMVQAFWAMYGDLSELAYDKLEA